MPTLRGIYNNLSESEYKYLYNKMVLYFSSKLYLEKFSNGIKDFIEEETAKIRSKYKVKIDLSNYLIIAYYRKIEKRGFFIKYNGERYKNYIEFSNIIVKGE